MSLEVHLEYLQNYLKDNKVSDKDVLAILSNYLLNSIETYEQIDINSKLLPKLYLEKYDNYSEIKAISEHFPNSISIQIAEIVHKLIYIYNQIRLEEEKIYGNKSK